MPGQETASGDNDQCLRPCGREYRRRDVVRTETSSSSEQRKHDPSGIRVTAEIREPGCSDGRVHRGATGMTTASTIVAVLSVRRKGKRHEVCHPWQVHV